MKVWTEETWLKHTEAECKRLGFAIIWCFRHTFCWWIQKSNSDFLPIPAGCNSKCQPVDVKLNKPFKAVLRRCLVIIMINSDTSFKLSVPIRSHMIDWVKEGFDYLFQDQVMVKKSFQVWDISLSDPDKERNGAFFKKL